MKLHPNFKLNGEAYNSVESLRVEAENLLKNGLAYEKEIASFLIMWLDDNDTLDVQTSGSTGRPKTITLSKQAMVASANATGQFFNLPENTSALLCLPASYIAGKMMLVRALVLGWHLDCVAPKSILQLKNKDYDFSAMVPMQLQKNSDSLNRIKTLIVGGAKVSNALKESVKHLKTRVFETYGMTETITHIAVKPINNSSEDSCFKTFPNIKVSQDDRGCLVIQAPRLSNEDIVTNDVVKLHDHKTFEWLGRIDNVINSGGVKLFPEQIEQKLQAKISERFFVASQPDDTLGSCLILVVETDNLQFNEELFSVLQPFEKPKQIYAIPKFIETTSSKVNRKATLQLLQFN